MNYLYLVTDTNLIPVGTEYRILFEDGDKPLVIQTKEPVAGLQEHPQKWENGVDCVDDGCVAEWQTVKDKTAEIEAEIDLAVAKIAELSFKYPDKVSKKIKASVDKPTTEGLLSADGAPIIIDAPQGWKK